MAICWPETHVGNFRSLVCACALLSGVPLVAQAPTEKTITIESATVTGQTIRATLASGDVLILTSKTPIVIAKTDAKPAGRSAQIREKCRADWPADFRMRAVCEKQQQQATTELDQRQMASGDRLTIRQTCETQWPTDMFMRNVCEQEQLKALSELTK